MTGRRAVEVAAVGLGLAVWGYVAWDGALWDARYQLALHLAAVVALGGLVAMAVSGAALPRTRVDLPILALLAAFGVATLVSENHGLSAPALAGILATAAMLPVALVVLRHRPGWTALVVTLPIIGLSAGALAVLVWRRVEWLLAGAPGAPPIRLPEEGTPFGSVAVPPFVILAALPLALLIPHRTLRLAVVLALAVVGVPLTLLSASRSAWLALAVTAIVLLAPAARDRARSFTRSWRWTPRHVGMALLAVAAAGLVIRYAAPRLTDATSLIYRGYLWRDTITAWSANPLFGVGPGVMPYARQAAAPPLSFPVQQPHSHDVPLGILGDAGVVGLVMAAVVVTSFVLVAGPRRQRSLPGRAAVAVLAGFAPSMLFEDLTFEPGFNLLLILLAAIGLADAGAVVWRPIRPRVAGMAVAAVAGAALLAVMAVGDGAAIAYRNGIDAAGEGRWVAAEGWFRQSVALNPLHPTGVKSLAVAADYAGNSPLARASAQRAVALSPGDADSWTNLALLCEAAGDQACARRAAGRAIDTASAGGLHLINAALVLDHLGDHAGADAAYRLSLLTNVWTGLASDWPRPIEIGSGELPQVGEERQGARPAAVDAAELRLVVARRILGEPILPRDYQTGPARALAFAMLGDRAAAEREAGRAIEEEPVELAVWDIAALLAEHYGEDPTRAIAVGDVLRAHSQGRDRRPPWDPRSYFPPVYDVGTFRAYPADGLVRESDRLLTDRSWPWAIDPLLAPSE